MIPKSKINNLVKVENFKNPFEYCFEKLKNDLKNDLLVTILNQNHEIKNNFNKDQIEFKNELEYDLE